MQFSYLFRRIAFALAVMMALTQTAPAQQAGLHLELNAMDDIAGECRLTFVGNNATQIDVLQIAYDAFIFDGSGIVTDRLILDFGRLRPARTRVLQFQLARGCAQISRVLLNEVQDCTMQDGLRSEMCIDALSTTSRAGAQFGL